MVDLSTIIKAYDVRGTVPDQLDEPIARAIGAAFVDVTGAGDTVIAAIALGLVSGLDLTESCILANYAAGVVVGQIGCVPCTVAELRQYIDELS